MDSKVDTGLAALLFAEAVFGFAHHEIICDDQGNPVDYRFLLVNPAFEKLTGMKAEDIIGRTILDLMPGTEHSWIQKYGKVALTGEPIQFENFSQELNKHFHVNAFSPKKGQFSVSFVDITPRIIAERKVLDSEERTRLVLDASELGFWDWNLKTGEVQRNEMWAKILGYTFEEIQFTVKQWEDFVHPEDRAKAWNSIKDHLDGKKPIHELEYRMICKDSSIKWILDRAKVVSYDEQGKPSRMCGTHADVTEKRRYAIEREELIKNLQLANSKIKTLSGLLPLCCKCHKIRNDKGYWSKLEVYIYDNTDAEISHGICPDCAKELYPELDWEDND